MKIKLLLVLLFGCSLTFAQQLSEEELLNLSDLNINAQTLEINELEIQKDLKSILELDQKRKTNKIVAISLTTAGLLTIVTGATLESDELGFVTDALGDVFVVAGIVTTGISIPFWTATSKKKKQRDQLIDSLE
ncbi:MAG: hypothetical protein ACWA5P_00860 [bacterium]